MKVAYIYYMVTKGQIGVENKIRQQARAIAAAGLHDLDILVLNPDREEKDGNVHYVKFNHTLPVLSYFDYFFRRYRLIERTVDLRPYDYLILRYPLADRSGIRFMRRHDVITEHNTDEPSELRSRLHSAGTLAERIGRVLLLRHEEKYAAQVLGASQGIIAATSEICEFERKRANSQAPLLTVGNGIDVENIPFTGFKRFDGSPLDILFVASSLRPWHGLDRLVASFNQYKGPVRWTIHVYGHIGPEDLAGAALDLAHVKFHGPKSTEELTAITPTMHLAISSLSEHRINLNEACPLKTREYTSRGIPFILAYVDPDLHPVDPENKFHLAFPNDDSPLDVQQIIQFASQVSARQQQISKFMREYALTHMDWRVKLKQYLAFVDETSRRARPNE